MDHVFADRSHIEQVREAVRAGHGEWEAVRFELDRAARTQMPRGPWSVTFHASPAPSKNPHDYCGEGKYWWPDPENPGGPFIQRDGIARPGRFDIHRSDLIDLADAVATLASAGYLLDNKTYLDRAMLLLRVWFIDPATRMTPKIAYGEFVQGRSDGRPGGLLAFRQVDRIVHALSFASPDPEYASDIFGMKQWLAECLEWLTTSPLGIEASQMHGNHASWWTVHVAAFASFVDDQTQMERAFTHFREHILPSQITAEGAMPAEQARTLSLHYSMFNLDAMAILCEIAWQRGVDLWHYKTEAGLGIELSVRYHLPFLKNAYEWRWPQIDGETPGEYVSIQLAGLRLDMPECRKVNIKNRRENAYISTWQERLAPLALLPGSILL